MIWEVNYAWKLNEWSKSENFDRCGIWTCDLQMSSLNALPTELTGHGNFSPVPGSHGFSVTFEESLAVVHLWCAQPPRLFCFFVSGVKIWSEIEIWQPLIFWPRILIYSPHPPFSGRAASLFFTTCFGSKYEKYLMYGVKLYINY